MSVLVNAMNLQEKIDFLGNAIEPIMFLSFPKYAFFLFTCRCLFNHIKLLDAKLKSTVCETWMLNQEAL